MSYLSHFTANTNSKGQNPTLPLKTFLLSVAAILQLIFGVAIMPGLNIVGQPVNWYVLLALGLGLLIPLLARRKEHLGFLYGTFAVGIILGYILSVG